MTGKSVTIIHHIHQIHRTCNFHFTSIILTFPSCSNVRLRIGLLLSALRARAPTLPGRLGSELFCSMLRSCTSVAIGHRQVGGVGTSPRCGTLRIGCTCTIAYRGTRNNR